MIHRFKYVLFDMDNTLLKNMVIGVVAQKKGFTEELDKLLERSIVSHEKNKEIALLLKGISEKELLAIFRTVPIQDHAEDVIIALKKKGIRTGIATNSYLYLAEDLKRRLGIDDVYGNTLVVKKGMITGELLLHNTSLEKKFDGCQMHPICKRSIIDRICETYKISPGDVIAVGDGRIDICMLETAGLGIAFNASFEVQQHADISTNDLRVILKYI